MAATSKNRRTFADKKGLDLAIPDYQSLPEIDNASLAPGENLQDRRLSAAISGFAKGTEFILIDCPGSHTRLSQVAHTLADTLITPLNDSFIDFDLLARVDGETNRILGPSVYSEMVWNARQLRAQAGLRPIDWIVTRNRVGAQAMHNKKKMADAVGALSRRIGFRVAPGFFRTRDLPRAVSARPDIARSQGSRRGATSTFRMSPPARSCAT